MSTPPKSDGPAQSTQPGTASPGRRPGLALLVITAATLLVTLDSTIVNVAQPSIKGSLGFTQASLEWVIVAYSVTFGGLLLLGGRTGDLYGRRRMFLIGIGLFTASSLFGGLATNATWLITARAAQGIGAAIASPAALSLIATTFTEGTARARAMAVYATVAGFGGSLGLVLGGVLTHFASWRWVFFVAVPVGALVLITAPKVLVDVKPRGGRLDLPGAFLGTGGIALLVYGLIHATQYAWGDAGALIPLVASPLLLIAFVVVESRVPSPMLPLHLFANRNRCAAYLVTLAVGVGLYGVTFLLMLYLQDVLGYDAIRAGFAFLPLALAIGILAVVMGRTAMKIGTKVGATYGPLVAAVGAVWLALATTDHSTYLDVVGPMIVLGVGLGAAIVPLTLTALSAIQPTEAGISSALVGAGQQIGGSIGLALLGTISTTAAHHKTHDPAGSGKSAHAIAASAGAHGYQIAFFVAAAVLAVAYALGAVMIKQARPPKQQKAAGPQPAEPGMAKG